MTRSRRLRIFLADDHALVRAGLKALINADPGMEVVGEVGDGQEALEEVPRLAPDVVVLDISMPRLSGARVAEELGKRCPHVKVVTLTVHADRAYWQHLLKSGAAGYVLKRSAADTLIHAIRTVAEGGVYADPGLGVGVLGGLMEEPALKGAPGTGDLSRRETEAIQGIARGLTNKELAGLLGVSVKTVEKHKARALEKLGLRSRVDLVKYALARGWLDPS